MGCRDSPHVIIESPRVLGRPDVVIFYADDLGWGELGCQGGTDIPIPHIDSLATNGVRCTQGYVAATCCSPSRAGLLTGRCPTRFGHEFNAIAGRPHETLFWRFADQWAVRSGHDQGREPRLPWE